MKKFCVAIVLIIFIFCDLKPVFADMDEFGLLIKQNEQQVRMNQYEINKQLNEEKINLIMQLNSQDNNMNPAQQPQGVKSQNKINKAK